MNLFEIFSIIVHPTPLVEQGILNMCGGAKKRLSFQNCVLNQSKLVYASIHIMILHSFFSPPSGRNS